MGQRLQWVWAVLTGFSSGNRPAEIDTDDLPFADGNTALWSPTPVMQHPSSEVEMVCWDNTLFQFFTRDASLSARFSQAFPEAVDLAEYCRRYHKTTTNSSWQSNMASNFYSPAELVSRNLNSKIEDFQSATRPNLTPEMVQAAEADLGVRLPNSYIEILKEQNGGYLKRSYFPTLVGDEVVEIKVLPGLGYEHGLDGPSGARYMSEEWGYPGGLLYLDGDGHTGVFLDYRASGPYNEPSISWLDLEVDNPVPIHVADSFGEFFASLTDVDPWPDDDLHSSEVPGRAELHRKAEMREWLGMSPADLLVYGAIAASAGMYFVRHPVWDIGLAVIALALAIVSCPIGMRTNPNLSEFTNAIRLVSYIPFLLLVVVWVVVHYAFFA